MESTNFHQTQDNFVGYPPPDPLPNKPSSYGASSTQEWRPNIPQTAGDYAGVSEPSDSNSLIQMAKTNSWLLNNPFVSSDSKHHSSYFPPPLEYEGLTHFTTTESSTPAISLNHLPFLLPYENHLPKEECVAPWGSLHDSSKAYAASMNAVAGTKRAGGCSDQPSKKSSLKTSCPPIKVRKEKLGDRIAALHQLVSPFGKTDTASVLTEAIGYIQFLQDQIHTLCMPNVKPFRNKPSRTLLQMGSSEEEGMEEANQNLRRRGLCLVPLSWTSFVATDPQLDPSHHHYFLNSNN